MQVWSVRARPATTVMVLGAVYSSDPSRGHTAAVTSVVSLANGTVASCSRDGRVIVWDIASPVTNRTVRVLSVAGSGEANCMTTLYSFQRLVPQPVVAVGYMDGGVRIWDWSSGLLLYTYTVARSSSVFALTVLSDRTLACGSLDGNVTLWDTVSSTDVLITLQVCLCSVACATAAVLPWARGTLRMHFGCTIGTMNMWQAWRGVMSCVLSCQHGAAVKSLAVSGSGQLVSGAEDGSVLAWRNGYQKPELLRT